MSQGVLAPMKRLNLNDRRDRGDHERHDHDQTSVKRKRSDLKCSICLQSCEDPSIIRVCGHKFCFQCIKQWIVQRPRCPLCKQRVDLIKYAFRRTLTSEPTWDDQGKTVTAREIIEEEEFRRISEHTWSLTSEMELLAAAIKHLDVMIRNTSIDGLPRVLELKSKLYNFRREAELMPRNQVISHILFRFVIYFMDADRHTLVTTHTDVDLKEHVRENRYQLRAEWLPFVAREIHAITGLQAIDIDRLMTLILDALEYPNKNKGALFGYLKIIGVDHPRTFLKNIQSFGSADQSMKLYDANSRYKVRTGLGSIFIDDTSDIQVITPPEDEDIQLVGEARRNAPRRNDDIQLIRESRRNVPFLVNDIQLISGARRITPSEEDQDVQLVGEERRTPDLIFLS